MALRPPAGYSVSLTPPLTCTSCHCLFFQTNFPHCVLTTLTTYLYPVLLVDSCWIILTFVLSMSVQTAEYTVCLIPACLWTFAWSDLCLPLDYSWDSDLAFLTLFGFFSCFSQHAGPWTTARERPWALFSSCATGVCFVIDRAEALLCPK